MGRIKKMDEQLKLTEKIESFETSQCYVNIYKTDKRFMTEEIYVITSVHKKYGKLLIRFGNAAQIASIRNTYRIIGQV